MRQFRAIQTLDLVEPAAQRGGGVGGAQNGGVGVRGQRKMGVVIGQHQPLVFIGHLQLARFQNGHQRLA